MFCSLFHKCAVSTSAGRRGRCVCVWSAALVPCIWSCLVTAAADKQAHPWHTERNELQILQSTLTRICNIE